MKRFFFLIIILLLLVGCNKSTLLLPTDEVQSMKIEYVNAPAKILYTQKENQKEIERFINALNKAEKIESSGIPNQPIKITLNFGKEADFVWGDIQGFQTLEQGHLKYTVKGEELSRLFKEYSTMLKQKENIQVKAIYLVSEQGGEISKKDLETHPEVLVVHSGDELKSMVTDKLGIAIWVDKNAMNQIDRDWFKGFPQKNLPTVLVGYGSVDYAHNLLGGFSVTGDWNQNPMVYGYSVWKLFYENNSGMSAFLKGYEEPITIENILAKTNPLIENRVPEELRPFAAQEIDKLEDYKIVEIKGLTQSVSALKKFEPETPKEFSAGRYKVTFQKGNDKKAVILETEKRVGHLERVIPGETVVDGYILLLAKADENSNGEKLTKPEEDYFIKMLYRKFQKPMIEEDAKLINDVKDFALAIYFNGKVGIKKYHENLKLSIQEDDDIINLHYGAFRVSLPSGWKKKVEHELEVTFMDEKGQNRGGASVLSYYYEEPGHGWRPNHSSYISQESIATSFGEGEMVVLERDYPSASGKDDVWKEVHAVIPIQNQELAFDFWLKVDKSVEEDKELLKRMLRLSMYYW